MANGPTYPQRRDAAKLLFGAARKKDGVPRDPLPVTDEGSFSFLSRRDIGNIGAIASLSLSLSLSLSRSQRLSDPEGHVARDVRN